MKNTTIFLAAALAATAAQAQTFEAQAAETIRSFASVDAFAGVDECAVLDIKTIRPFNLDEVSGLVKPCLAAAAKKYAASAVAESGFVSAPQSGQPAKIGLLIKTDLVPGSKGHRDMSLALSRRDSQLLGQSAKLLTKDEPAPASISALQKALDGCVQATVVRDLRTSDDFVKIYGRCLTRNPALKIKEVRAADGLAVTVQTEAEAAQVEAYNGFVTVNAGKGPVKLMVVAYGRQIVLP